MGPKLVKVSLSIGSNINRYKNIVSGLEFLAAHFGDVVCSSVYESDAVGFEGDPFLNLVAIVETNLSLLEVNALLKRIEDDHGRDRQSPKFSSRCLDIDVITYGSLFGVVEGISLPRPELFKNSFVSLPLAELWPEDLVPGTTLSFADVSNNCSNNDLLQKVSFDYSPIFSKG